MKRDAPRATEMYPITCVTYMSAIAFTGIALVFSLYLPILDCDETFNFWEPLHYLMFGWGLQTWEYSPKFALRSWLYIKIHQLSLLPVQIFFGRVHKAAYFYSLKMLLGVITGMSAIRFRTKVGEAFNDQFTTTLTLAILGGVGLYTSAVSFLPTSFSMILQFLGIAEWLSLSGDDIPKWRCIVAFHITSYVFGWPFAVLGALPIAIHFLSLVDIYLCAFGLIVTLLTCCMSLIIDSHFYGRITFPVFNLIQYNVFPSDGTGAHLYGTEPAIFILKNLFLCFNFVFLAAILSPVVCFFNRYASDSRKSRDIWIAPAMTWVLLLFWSQVAHKEERFFFHLYPYILLAGTIAIDTVYGLLLKRYSRWIANLSYGIFFMLYFSLSAARSAALFTLYSAPRELHNELHHSVMHPKPRVICYSHEWYRFPSNFFLPDATSVSFVHAPGMTSQLPLPFLSPGSTVNSFNNKNLVNAKQFIDASKCDFFVTSDSKQVNQTAWKLLHSGPIVSPEDTEWYYRAFYIPYLSDRKLKYSDFAIYSRKDVKAEDDL